MSKTAIPQNQSAINVTVGTPAASLGRTDLSTYVVNRTEKRKNILVAGSWYMINSIFFKSAFFPFYKLKAAVLRLFGAKVGKGVVIKPCVNIKFPWKLTIGDHTWIGEDAWIDNLAEVTIGSNVCISQGAMLLTGNHDFSKSSFNLITRKIELEDGVWIGAKSVVCPGVSCKSHAVLSVNSVATRDLSSYTVFQGNPAVPVKQRVVL